MKTNTMILFVSIGFAAVQPAVSCALFCWWLYRLEHRKT